MAATRHVGRVPETRCILPGRRTSRFGETLNVILNCGSDRLKMAEQPWAHIIHGEL